jgi:hypothetical protein
VLPETVVSIAGSAITEAQRGAAAPLSAWRTTFWHPLSDVPISPLTWQSDNGELWVELGPALTAVGGAAFATPTDVPVLLEAFSGSELRWRRRGSALLTYSTSLTPALEPAGPGAALILGGAFELSGSGFLLGNEGDTAVRLRGTVSQGAAESREIVDLVLPSLVTDRGRLVAAMGPDGLAPDATHIEGWLELTNTHTSGEITASAKAPLDATLGRPTLLAALPPVASRGLWLPVQGHGLNAVNPPGAAQPWLALEGALLTSAGIAVDFTGDNTAWLPLGVSGDGRPSVVLRPSNDAVGRLVGLGAEAGTFRGVATPAFLGKATFVQGIASPVELSIERPRQVVLLRPLAEFSSALARFGLHVCAQRIKAEALQAATRPYGNLDIEFSYDPPPLAADFTVVELGGADPNGALLFGLDNTTGKDVGNLRLDDTLGGVNGETAAQGLLAYGGVFVESFFAISPGLGIGAGGGKDSRFDEIFGPFAAELGGEPLAGTCPAEGAVAELDFAIYVLGGLIGSTVAHEVGHALGLTALEGQLHNVGDNPAWIMDAGVYRPFGERVAIDGEGPEVFAPFDWDYLEALLPERSP